MDLLLLSLAFSSGLAAFFAPCSFLLLPGYLTHYLGASSSRWEGFRIGLFASLGFLLLFSSVGVLVLWIGQAVKAAIPWIAVMTGGVLIVVGFLIMRGREVFLSLPHPQSEGAVLFGVAYGVASLGCTFPLFLSVAVMGLADRSLMPVLAYVLGMAVLMIASTVLVTFSKDVLHSFIVPRIGVIKRVSGGILVLAGTYLLYWQWRLLFG